jgi:hypothetical protein
MWALRPAANRTDDHMHWWRHIGCDARTGGRPDRVCLQAVAHLPRPAAPKRGVETAARSADDTRKRHPCFGNDGCIESLQHY